MKYFVASMFVIFSVGYGCDSTVEVIDDSRIGPDGVDGFRFGDSLGTVLDSLGRPLGLDFIDGIKSFQGYNYADSLSVFTAGDFLTSSPIDAFAVTNSYSGETIEGLGLGSRLDIILDELGSPEIILQDIFHIYCKNKRFLMFGIDSDTVATIFYGTTTAVGDPVECN